MAAGGAVAATRVWFLRHAEVEADRLGAFLGRTDARLSDVGRHQAEAIKAYLEDAPLDAVLSSPARRALDTGAPLARHLGQKLEVRAAFAEMDFGAFDGLHWREIVARDEAAALHWQQDLMARAAPGGETGTAFQHRIAGALQSVLEEFRGRMVCVAGHAGTSRAILAETLRIPYVQAFAFAADYGSLNACWFEDGWAQVALTNFVPGPRSQDQGDKRLEGSEAPRPAAPSADGRI